MASRIIAQLLVAGGAMVFRAAAQAYRQAIVNGQRAGVTPESLRKAVKQEMSIQEARMILGVDGDATWEEIMKKYEHLFSVNEKQGTFYLQSKVYRARERLEAEYQQQRQQQQQ